MEAIKIRNNKSIRNNVQKGYSRFNIVIFSYDFRSFFRLSFTLLSFSHTDVASSTMQENPVTLPSRGFKPAFPVYTIFYFSMSLVNSEAENCTLTTTIHVQLLSNQRNCPCSSPAARSPVEQGHPLEFLHTPFLQSLQH